MPFKLSSIEIVDCSDSNQLPKFIETCQQPLVLKGLVNHWPAVKAGALSSDALSSYLLKFYRGQAVTAFLGEPEIRGRFFYNQDFSGFNFKRGSATLDQILVKLKVAQTEANPQSIYMGSTMLDKWLPGFSNHNPLSVPAAEALGSIWLGNASSVSAHYDFPDNIACVVAGRRRFTLLPPEQIDNLYIGPLDLTPSGQAISLVDFNQPDFNKFPKFEAALEQAQMAELDPGDGIFIPSMWWHQVEALSTFNVLVNYWWCNSPAFLGSPSLSLKHAILALRDLPAEQRKLWQSLFDYYVFEHDRHEQSHIPASGRGMLSELNQEAADQIKAEILRQLS